MYATNLLSEYVLISLGATLFFSGLVAFCISLSYKTSKGMHAYVLWAALIIPFFLFIHAIGRFGIDLPYLDDYDAFLAYFLKPFDQRLRSIFSYHNEHRIAFARLVAEGVYALKGTLDFRWIILIGNGFFLLLTALLLYGLRKNSALYWWAIPFSWAFLSILLFQNMLWAITAVTSNCVVLFAYLAFRCIDSKKTYYFLWAILFAFLATYTAGSGMFVWICLLAMLFKISLIDHCSVGKFKFLALLMAAVVAVGCYFLSFPPAATATMVLTGRFVINVVLFSAVFCGAAFHFFMPSLIIGLCVIAFASYLLFNLQKIKNNGMLFFLLYLLMTAGTAALFRCEEFGVTGALGFRYRINSLCILFCCSILASELFVLPAKYIRYLCVLATFGFVALNLAAYLLAYPQLITRKEKQMEGLSAWQTHPAGLIYHTNRLEHAQQLLEASKKKGTYDPDIAR